MESLLSTGAISRILSGEKPANPVLQLIGYTPIEPSQSLGEHSSTELRYRLMIGDGVEEYRHCVLTDKVLVQEFKKGQIEKWSIIRLVSYEIIEYNSPTYKITRRIIYIHNASITKKGREVSKKLNANPVTQTITDDSVPTLDFNNNLHQPQTTSRTVNLDQTTESQEPTPEPYSIRFIDNLHSPREPPERYYDQTVSISELTPYISKWLIKGRCVAKGPIHDYNNVRGVGKVFNFILADKSGEVKVTAFNADCDRVHSRIEQSKVYYLGLATIKDANKRYTSANHEIILNQNSLLEEITEQSAIRDIPFAKFNFCSVGSITNHPLNQPIDLIGAITATTEISFIKSKTKNRELKKRSVTIVDMSRHTIDVTIWDDHVDGFSGKVGDVFVTKNARLATYGGRSASAGDCILINPDMTETNKIKSWFANLIDQNFIHLTNTQTFMDIAYKWASITQLNDLQSFKNIASNSTTTVRYSRCRAMIMLAGKNLVYRACPNNGCGKKLRDYEDGLLECQKCCRTFDHVKHRYKADIEIVDQTSSCWITLWDEMAETLFGETPEETWRFMTMEDRTAYENLVSRPLFKAFVFNLRSDVTTYNNRENIRHSVVSITQAETVPYTKLLFEQIRSLAN